MQEMLEKIYQELEFEIKGPYKDEIIQSGKQGKEKIIEYIKQQGLEDFSVRQYEELFALMCGLFDAQLKDKFMRGLDVGFKLHNELEQYNN